MKSVLMPSALRKDNRIMIIILDSYLYSLSASKKSPRTITTAKDKHSDEDTGIRLSLSFNQW